MCRHHMGMRSPGWGNVWPLPSKSRQVHGVDKCVTQGFVGEAMGWGSQRSLLTRVGIMVIKEIFLKERQPKHKKEQGERTRQRTPRQNLGRSSGCAVPLSVALRQGKTANLKAFALAVPSAHSGLQIGLLILYVSAQRGSLHPNSPSPKAPFLLSS